MDGNNEKISQYSLAKSVYKGIQAPAIIGIIAAILPIVSNGKISTDVAGGIGVVVAGIFGGVSNWFKNRHQ
jgi:hypothetical protein